MNRTRKISVLTVLVIAVTVFGIYCTSKSNSPSLQVKAGFDADLLQLTSIVEKDLLNAAEKNDIQQVKRFFLAARNQYKKIEYYMEYFFPTTAVLINGAPIDEIELGENIVEAPSGFQVMEEIIYDEPSKENWASLTNEIKKMNLSLKRIARYNEQYELTDAQIFDAIRLEIFRITSLGITGFDTPTALQSLPETASALNGIKKAISAYGAPEKAIMKIEESMSFIYAAKDYNSFNRLDFITEHLQPISKNIDQLRSQQNIELVSGSSAMSDDATNLFQKNALNVNKFVGNHTEYISKEKVALGKLLFNSTILSKAGKTSCASCHHESKAFSDGLTKAQGLVSISSGKANALLRNTPTLTYAGFQRAFFYDLKAGSLEDQALDVVHHKQEMDGSLELASSKINQSGTFKPSFTKAFGAENATATPWKIQHALASYIRSLAPFSSRLDEYMRGEKSSLNPEEKEGFNLFMGKAKCGSCHFAPLFNGTQSPLFSKSEAEVLGVPTKPDTINATIDKDLGRFALNPYPQYKHAFKTTTVRNISKTAPYMHNGVYKSLEEVLDFYNRGGGAGIGIQLENQTLAADPLNLSKKEMKSIIAFLKTLDDQ